MADTSRWGRRQAAEKVACGGGQRALPGDCAEKKGQTGNRGDRSTKTREGK